MRVHAKIFYSAVPNRERAAQFCASVTVSFDEGTPEEYVELTRETNLSLRDLEGCRIFFAETPSAVQRIAHDEVEKYITLARRICPEIVPDDEDFTIEVTSARKGEK